jgi:hypothetical protein
MPTELHLALQRHYAGDTGVLEAELGAYRPDVLRDGVVYEIQTGAFSAIRKKLRELSRTHRVVLVYPIPYEKIIVRLDPSSGEELSARRSPKRGALLDVFDELLYIPDVLQRATVSLEVVMTIQRELRRDDGRGSWHRKGVSVVGHDLVEILQTHRFHHATDFLRLLPHGLPKRFTVADISQAARVNHSAAGRIAYGLRRLGAIRQVGKQGSAYVYERTKAPGQRKRPPKPTHIP